MGMDKSFQTRFVESILDYYYCNTEQGTRERVLGVMPSVIELDSNYPYYDVGVRSLEFNPENINRYNLYCDVYFLSSDDFKQFNRVYISELEIYSHSLYVYNNLFVISDEYDYIFDVPFDNRIIYNIDLSRFNLYIKDGMIIDFKNFRNIVESNIGIVLNEFNFACYLRETDGEIFNFNDFKFIYDFMLGRSYDKLGFLMMVGKNRDGLECLFSEIISHYNYLNIRIDIYYAVREFNDNIFISNFINKYRKNFRELEIHEM